MRLPHIGVMQLSAFMLANDLDDGEMAARIREAGVSVDRSTISRLRRGKMWLSRELAAAIRAATENAVTADDFMEAAPSGQHPTKASP